mmetsp:Transcript_56702/g.94101  ORF Transcript_56702/g.94101 Transcript_56702/m.94101 type:complete len:323 (+) Transcript_56702:1282-2250(+)
MRGSTSKFRATFIASSRLRSISFRASFEGPRIRIVHALGSRHSSMNTKYSSPTFRTSISPHCVPTSQSCSSSVRCTMVAPVARAIRLLSVLRHRRKAVTPAFIKKCAAMSERPFSVNTTSGLNFAMSSHSPLTYSSSSFSSSSKLEASLSSTLMAFSPFLYSRGQSRRMTRGFLMLLFMRGWHTSLFSMTPEITFESMYSPPGIFSTFAYRLKSISLRAVTLSTVYTVFTASMARSVINDSSRPIIFVPRQLATHRAISFLSSMSSGTATLAAKITASSRAQAKPWTILMGWMFCSTYLCAIDSISPARMMTDVVPSPTSSS